MTLFNFLHFKGCLFLLGKYNFYVFFELKGLYTEGVLFFSKKRGIFCKTLLINIL